MQLGSWLGHIVKHVYRLQVYGQREKKSDTQSSRPVKFPIVAWSPQAFQHSSTLVPPHTVVFLPCRADHMWQPGRTSAEHTVHKHVHQIGRCICMLYRRNVYVRNTKQNKVYSVVMGCPLMAGWHFSPWKTLMPLWTALSSAYVAGACQSQRLVHGCRHCEAIKMMAALGTHTACTVTRVQTDKCTYVMQPMGTSTSPYTWFLTDLLSERLAGY